MINLNLRNVKTCTHVENYCMQNSTYNKLFPSKKLKYHFRHFSVYVQHTRRKFLKYITNRWDDYRCAQLVYIYIYIYIRAARIDN